MTISVRVLAVSVVGVVLAGSSISGQDLSRYRGYVLEGDLASVAKASGARAADAKTLHERPAKIQELQWRTPYVSAGTERADPVRDVVFGFCDGQLFRIVVSYDRDRMEGLTNDDVIESITATYGVPVLSSARTSGSAPLGAGVPMETTVVAQWEDASSLLTLLRGTYSPEFQLVLISKTLNARARDAIRDALRLDDEEAPQREIDRRKKDAVNARAVLDKARVVNKAAFRP